MHPLRTAARTLLGLLLALAPAWAQPEPASSLSGGRPPIVETLGDERFVKLTGVNEAGKVVWFNWRLAEALGLDLPRGNVMTPAFEAELVRHLAFRLLKPGEAAGGRPTVDMYRAGAANRNATTVIRSGEAEIFAQDPEQGIPRDHIQLVGSAVDVQCEHARLPRCRSRG